MSFEKYTHRVINEKTIYITQKVISYLFAIKFPFIPIPKKNFTCFLLLLILWKYTICTILCLISGTQHNIFEIHPCHCICPSLMFSLLSSIITLCKHIKIYPFTCLMILELFVLVWGYYE